MSEPARLAHVRTPSLDIAYEESGPREGAPVILLHGFPYSPRAYDGVAPALAAAGFRVIVPYLRGFGATRFLEEATPRSGQQGAIGADLRDLIEALALPPALLVGFDWGGRAACVAAALWPERVRGLVTVGGYLIQDIAGATRPAPPAMEHRFWYLYYLCTERGRRALEERRDELCRYFWEQWSPGHPIDDAVFAVSAAAFDNPDFAAVATHSYRHRQGAAPGDPAYDEIERRLAARPAIAVPALLLLSGIFAAGPARDHTGDFPHLYDVVRLPEAGHNPAHEAPQATLAAILRLAAATVS